MQIIKGVLKKAQKVVVYGPEGIGKSTLASQFPDPLFIDTEGSTKLMDVARTPDPTSWTMLMEQIRYVKAKPDLCRTLVIDTADWAERLCIEHICSKSNVDGIEGFGYGKGYTYLEEEFGRLLNLLEDVIDMGVHVVITAHAAMRKFEQPNEMGAYDRWELKLQKKTAPLLKEWADMVLFANYKTYVVNVDGQGAQKGKNKAQGGKRVMYTSHHPCWDAKNRHGLPGEIDMDYRQIAHCIEGFQDAEAAPAPAEEPSTEIKKTETETQMEPKAEPRQKSEPEPKQEPPAEPDPKPAEPEPNKPCEPNPPKEEAGHPPFQVQGPDLPHLKPLYDLMAPNAVSVEEIQEVVTARGYYSAGTPIENYEPEFVSGVLIAAWPQVWKMIDEAREEIPF